MNETIRKDQQLITTRVFQAPQELVFEAWTDPEHLAHWFGPDGFTITTEKFELKVDGEWKFMMHGPDGVDYPNLIRFKKIERPELLEYLQMSDEHSDDTFYVIVSFSEMDGKTKMVMDMSFKTKEDLDYVIEEFGAMEGQEQTLGRLEAYLTSLT